MTRRPRLAVLFDEESVDAFALAEAICDLAELVWLVDTEHFPSRGAGRLLQRMGEVVDLAGRTPAEVAARLSAPVDGLMVMNETRLADVPPLAEALGVWAFSAATVEALTHKHVQRARFREAGVPSPAATLLPAGLTEEEVLVALGDLGYPLVAKPVQGRSSRRTGELPDPHTARQFWQAVGIPLQEAFVAEQRIVDGWPVEERPAADVVSVESFLVQGEARHLCVTGRPRPASGFRETGLVVPADVPPEEWPGLTALAEAAIRALGTDRGVFHTELKLGADGVRVVEVNGRLGGGLVPLVESATGISMWELAGRVALDLPVGPGQVEFARVAYEYDLQPPADARSVLALHGLDEARGLSGVDRVTVFRGEGSAVDVVEQGTWSAVLGVWGSGATHEDVWATIDEVCATIQVEYSS